MLDIILDSAIDSVRLLPFLFVVFLILELLEHCVNARTQKIIQQCETTGPLWGSLLGAFPQCGFSVAATNLFSNKLISLGTLVAVYLSTSDEMLPLMILHQWPLSTMFKIVVFKVLVGIMIGFGLDFFCKKRGAPLENLAEFCKEENCHCNEGYPIVSALKHTLNVFLFIFLVSFILNFTIAYLGEDTLKNAIAQTGFFAPLVSSLVGLIPNCAASVVITELYIAQAITTGTLLAGLLTGSGVALVVLFKVNASKRENLKILGIVYAVGATIGILIDFFQISF